MSYYIAIDGGGTKTEGLLCTDDGSIVCRAAGGASNPNDIGMKQSCECLRAVADELCAALPDGATASSLFAGVSGAVGNADALEAALDGTATSVRVASDAVNLLSCAGSGDGACLISGTGSVCFVRTGSKIHRIGGWGYLIDGAGGGYDIGRDALAAVLRAYDGRGEKTSLTAGLEKIFGTTVAEAIPEIYRGGKSRIASLAPIVFDAADSGDAVSQQILDRNAAYLAEILEAAARLLRHGTNESCRVILGGSLLTAADGLYDRLRASVPRHIRLIRTGAPPVYGAFCEALSADGREPSPTCRDRFLCDYRSIRMKNDEEKA